MSADELIHIVNEQDEVIGTMTRAEAYAGGYALRIACVMVYTSDGKIVLQRVSKRKHKNPGKWAYSAAGHVAAGETYEQAAVRELNEELGISGVIDGFIGQVRLISEKTGRPGPFHRVYRVLHDGPYTLDLNEGEELGIFTVDEIKQMVRETPDEFSDWLIELFRILKML